MKEGKDNFFDLVFEKMEDEDAFDFEDKELEKYRMKNSNVSSKLYNFINTRVHPKSRQKLLELIEENEFANSNYYFRENQLYYKNGFLQGMFVMISMFYTEKGKN